MDVLDNLRYTKNHEWVLVEGNMATIGITDHAQRELGDIVYLDIDTLSQELSEDDVFGSVEAVKTVSDLFMPVSGKVVEFNNLLDSSPELVNQEPYNNGWIIKVEVNEKHSITNLLSPNEYREIIGL